MADELTLYQKSDLVSVLEKQGLNNVMQPLIREIHLFDTFVAGTTHLTDKSVLGEILVGDKLILTKENNKFDDNAILIKTESCKKLGYIPEKDNLIFARQMDAGKLMAARITKIEKRGSFHQISIGIYLIDF